MTARINYGIAKSASMLTPHSGYKFWIPMLQAVASGTTAFDRSGNNAGAVADASSSAAAMWATAGQLTTAAGTNTGCTIPATKFDWNMAAGQSLLFSVWMKRTGGVVAVGLFGSFSAGSTGAGVRWRENNVAGESRMQIFDINGLVGAEPLVTGYLDGNWHHHGLFVNGTTKTLYVYHDGAYSSTTSISNVTGSTISETGFGFGHDGDGGTLEANFRDAHYIVTSGGMPSNLSSIMKLLYMRPFFPLTDSDFT